MNPIVHPFIIDLQTKYNRIVQYEIKQFDTDSHKFAFTLLNNSVAYNLTGLTGKIYIKKPNGQEVFSNLTIDSATGGKLSFLLTTQCLTVPGVVEAEITLYGNSGEVLTSITFTYIVKPVLRDDTAIESTNEYTALTEALAEVTGFTNLRTEVETARGGEVNLNTRLNGIASSLEENAKIIEGTDGGAITLEIASYSSQGYKIKFKRTTYELTTSINIPDNAEVDFNSCIIKRKTGSGVFDLVKNSNQTTGNININVYNLNLDGNKNADSLVNSNSAHRFSGLKFKNVTGFKLNNIDVINTCSAEIQAEGNNAGTLIELSEGEAVNINGSYNAGTAVLLVNSKVKISGSKTHDNTGSGISSYASDDCKYFDIETYNNGYSNLSVNGRRSIVNNVTSYGSAYSGVNIGHNDQSSDDTQLSNIISYNNGYEGLTIAGCSNIQGTNIIVYGNARNNIRIFDGATKTKLLNIDCHNSAGGQGILYESGEGHLIDNAKVYANHTSGINVGTGAKVKIGNNVECFNNGRVVSTNSAGVIFNNASGCEIGTAKLYDNQTTKTQESGLWIAGGSGHKVFLLTAENNKTYQIRKTSAPTGIIEMYPSSGVIAVSSFLNSWIGAGVSYEKDANGNVHVWGRLNSGSVGVVAFNLPTGFRPGSTINRATIANNTIAYVGIATNGDFVPYVSNVNHDFDLTFKQVL